MWRRKPIVPLLVMTVLVTAASYPYSRRRNGALYPGLDFQIYWGAARLANAGHNPYQPIWRALGFVYPPAALLPFRLLGHLPLGSAYLVWITTSALAVAGMCWLAVRRGMSWWWLVPLLAVLTLNQYTLRCVLLGQVGLVLLGLVVLDVVALSGRRGAGLLTGVAIGVKFTPAVLVLYFLARRQWRAVAMSVLGFLATVLFGLVLMPSTSAHYWAQLLLHHRLGTGVPSQYGAVNNQSLTNAVVLWGGPRLLGRLLAVLGCLAGLWAGALATRRGLAWLAVAVLGTASCLLTSSTWDHHYVWMLAAVVALAAGELRRLPVTSLVVLVWTLWSFVGTWQDLRWTPASRMTFAQHLQATGTPILALLLVATVGCELRFRRRSTSRPARAER